jgi:hypothetical protein
MATAPNPFSDIQRMLKDLQKEADAARKALEKKP